MATSGGGSYPPSGSAGGDLTGTYPNPTIGAGKVTLAKQAALAADSIQGNNTGAPATPIALTVAQVLTLLGALTSWGLESTSHFTHAGDPNGAVTALAKGDLCIDTTTPAIWIAAGAGTVWTVVGGGSTPGAVIARAFPFAYNSPGISSPNGAITGYATGYTPAIGDLLMGAAVIITTAFDGTTPLLDFGFPDINPPYGGVLFNIDSLAADATQSFSHSNVGAATFTPGGMDVLNLVTGSVLTGSGLNPVTLTLPNYYPLNSSWPVPATTASELFIWVSTTGLLTGDDPVASHGAGVLYLWTATPI